MESMQKDEDGMILDSRILNFAHEISFFDDKFHFT